METTAVKWTGLDNVYCFYLIHCYVASPVYNHKDDDGDKNYYIEQINGNRKHVLGNDNHSNSVIIRIIIIIIMIIIIMILLIIIIIIIIIIMIIIIIIISIIFFKSYD